MPIGMPDDEGAFPVNVQSGAVVYHSVGANHRYFLTQGDTIGPVLGEDLLFSGKIHAVQRIHHGCSDFGAVNGFAGDGSQGTGHGPDLLRELGFLLRAVDAHTHDGPIHITPGIEAQFGEDAGQFALPVNQVVGPLDAGAETTGSFHGVAEGDRRSASQVHQFRRRTFRTKDDTHVNTGTGGGMEASAPTAAAAGLVVRDEDGAMGRTLESQLLSVGVGGVNGLKVEQRILPVAGFS